MFLDFKEEYILENEYVELRPLQLSDFKNLKRFSVNEPELWAYSLVPANSEKNLKNYLASAIRSRESETAYPFIIYDKINNQYAGSTRFYDVHLASSCVQLGYTWFGQQFQRTGLNRHCKFLMLEFIFDTLNGMRIEFRADNENQQSIKAMKNIGCIEEGVLRSNGYKSDGTRRDSIILSILNKEWKGELKDQLRAKCKPVEAFSE